MSQKYEASFALHTGVEGIIGKGDTRTEAVNDLRAQLIAREIHNTEIESGLRLLATSAGSILGSKWSMVAITIQP